MVKTKVVFNPEPGEEGSGLTASVLWSHPNFYNAICLAINKQDHEQIKQIEITKEGIVVRLQAVGVV